MEWLDPAIKKTDWSKEEDEKLLHMAKLMPTQWRTIAPIVGRTANQCLERYQKLLDEAEARDRADADGSAADAGPSSFGLTGDGGGMAPTADDVRRLRPGERDTDPETKPARPDPIDMDEDEKEMLSEARARLANTQGKKAKRKAREKALEDARRLAMLQKRRELKAAGIIIRPKAPKRGMDYNADIPFEKQPTIGFFDTSEEQSKSYRAPLGRTVKQLDGREKGQEQDSENKKREKEAEQKKQKAAGKDPFGGQKEEQIRKLREAEQISKRRKLNLPAAQVGEAELEEIAKLGQAGESARSLVADGADASEGLLGDYSALERAKQIRTPRTAPEGECSSFPLSLEKISDRLRFNAPVEDVVMREARNLRNMTEAQTPLLGDANVTLLEGTGHEGAAPRASVYQTPNPLLTPAQRAARGFLPGETPMADRPGVMATPRTDAGSVSQTPMRTPFRDSLGVNTADGMSAVSATPRDDKRSRLSAQRQLQSALASLPAPKNEFEIQLEEDAAGDENAINEAALQGTLSIEDAGERDAKIAALKEEQRQRVLARRSQAVQKGLPRPANIDANALRTMLEAMPQEAGVAGKAQRLVEAEMIQLLHHDSVMHPVPGTEQAGPYKGKPILTNIGDDALAAARQLIHKELAGSLGFPGASESNLARLIASTFEESGDVQSLEQALKEEREAFVWHAAIGMWVRRSDVSEKDVLQGKAALLEKDRERMAQTSAAAAKEEKRLGKTLGGYQARSKALRDQISESVNSRDEASFTRNAFEHLMVGEEHAITERIERAEREFRSLDARYNVAQGRFRELDEERRAVRKAVEELQTQAEMRHAEKALAAMED